MKKNAFVIVMGLIMALPISAQSWNSWDTHRTISVVFGIANAAIESAERKKEMEIHARQKVEFEQSFKDAMTEALPDNATEFDFIVPSSVWQFKDIKCK